MSLSEVKKAVVAAVGLLVLLLANLFGLDIDGAKLESVSLDLVDVIVGFATVFGVFQARNVRKTAAVRDDLRRV